MEILSLGEKIKKRRKELDLTLKNLAGDRITAGQISLIESGKSNPSMDLLEYLAGTLNVSVEHLMETEQTQAEKICEYYQNIAEVNIFDCNLDTAEKALEISCDYAKKYNLELRRATNLYLKALICKNKNEYGQAQDLLLLANNIYGKYNYYDEIIKIFILLGKIALKQNAYHCAYSYFKQAEKIFEASDVYNEVLIGEVYYYVSKTLRKMGFDKEAIKYMNYAEEKVEKLKDSRNYGKSFLKIGQDRFETENLDQAIAYTKKSLNIFRTREQNIEITNLLSGMGELFSEYGYLDKSFSHLVDAKHIKERVPEESEVDTLMLICTNYIKLKDDINAKKILDQISTNLQSMNETDCTLMCRYHTLKYRIELLEQNYDEAERTLIDTLSYTQKMNYNRESAGIAITLGKFYMDSGRETEASKYLDEGVKILEETNMIMDF